LEPLRLELPLVEFDPAVTLLICFVRYLAVRAVGELRQLLVVFAVPERVGGRELHRCAELRTAARIDRLVHRVACEDEFEREQVGGAVGHAERIPVFEREAFVARLAVKREVGVGPVETLAQTCRQTVRAEVLRTLLPYVIGVVLLGEVGRYGERIGLLAAQPRVGETQGERLVIGAVGLRRQRQPLVLAHRVGAPCALLEEVLDRKVVERDAH